MNENCQMCGGEGHCDLCNALARVKEEQSENADLRHLKCVMHEEIVTLQAKLAASEARVKALEAERERLLMTDATHVKEGKENKP